MKSFALAAALLLASWSPLLAQTTDRSSQTFLTVERQPSVSPKKEMMTFEAFPVGTANPMTTPLRFVVRLHNATAGTPLGETTSETCPKLREQLAALASLKPQFMDFRTLPDTYPPRPAMDGTSYSVTGRANYGGNPVQANMTLVSGSFTELATWVEDTFSVVRDCFKATS